MTITKVISVPVAIGALLLVAGCASWQSDKGVETIWRQPEHHQWNVGKTTDADVINALGPPSQIIALEDETVFYYVREENSGQAQIFIIWNRAREHTQYDRAVFFFDNKGVLLKYAYSKEQEASNSENQ